MISFIFYLMLGMIIGDAMASVTQFRRRYKDALDRYKEVKELLEQEERCANFKETYDGFGG